jgi:hypothetical protein
VNSPFEWQGGNSPIIFLRPIGITAADALRLMESARRAAMPVRWRMAPQGVASDAYVVHKHSVEVLGDSPSSHNSVWNHSQASPHVTLHATPITPVAPGADSSGIHSSRGFIPNKIKLDPFGWHRGRPVSVLGSQVDTSGISEQDLAPLPFPEALQELQQGLQHVMQELVGLRMLYQVGMLTWERRERWRTHRLHVFDDNQLVAVIEPDLWRFHLLDGCTVERLTKAHVTPMPRSGKFHGQGFQSFALETALWEFAKRCPEPMLQLILPARYLTEPLTHRRTPHLKEHALGDHCVAILRALDTQSRTADELETSLRMKRASLMRALTCLALVRAIRPESHRTGWSSQISGWWGRMTGAGRRDDLQTLRLSV